MNLQMLGCRCSFVKFFRLTAHDLKLHTGKDEVRTYLNLTESDPRWRGLF